MDYLIICLVAAAAAGLTLISGFGLGTVLLPVFALFFPLPAAIAATAVVHLANNVFKLALVGRHANGAAVLRFGVPAALAAVGGAALLNALATARPLLAYRFAGLDCEVTLVKLVIAVVIVIFALLELTPAWSRVSFDRKFLPLGGIVSGFFGGLSGNQGALRSAFLIKAGLSKEEFVATGVASTAMVDTVRLVVYGVGFYAEKFAGLTGELGGLILAATLAAGVGSFLGARWIKKMTLRAVQLIVGVMLLVIGLAMAAGIV